MSLDKWLLLLCLLESLNKFWLMYRCNDPNRQQQLTLLHPWAEGLLDIYFIWKPMPMLLQSTRTTTTIISMRYIHGLKEAVLNARVCTNTKVFNVLTLHYSQTHQQSKNCVFISWSLSLSLLVAQPFLFSLSWWYLLSFSLTHTGTSTYHTSSLSLMHCHLSPYAIWTKMLKILPTVLES